MGELCEPKTNKRRGEQCEPERGSYDQSKF